MASSSTPKSRHYTTQLRSALVSGSFASSIPGKGPSAEPLSWAELLRKHGKHCTTSDDHILAGAANQIQSLALLLGASHTNGKGNIDDKAVDGDSVWGGHEELKLGGEGLLLPERKEEVTTGYKALDSLGNSRSVMLSRAWYAYALGQFNETISILSSVPNLDSSNTLPLSTTSTSLTVPSAGRPTSVRSFGGPSVSPVQDPPDIVDGSAWSITETVRSLCLLGLAHEHTSSTTPSLALNSYLSALSIIQSLSSSITRGTGNATAPSPSRDDSPFTRYREFWRWSEKLLWRAIVLLSKRLPSEGPNKSDDLPPAVQREQLSSLLSLYVSFPFPAHFRPGHRSTVYRLHLRHIVLGSSMSSSSDNTDRLREWLSEARTAASELRAILTVATTFPKADERNLPVLEFCDAVVGVWEASGAKGEGAGWVIDILWWATRLTFNAPSLFRHQARLLAASGDLQLARRFTRLYIQVVSKSREAASASSDGGIALDTDATDGGGAEVAHVHLEDLDSDAGWVNACLEGARILVKLAMEERDGQKEGGKGVEWAREARDVVRRARERLPRRRGIDRKNEKEDDHDRHEIGGEVVTQESEEWTERRAKIDLWESIVESVLAITEQNPTTRSDQLKRSVTLAEQSLAIFPTAEAYHHLATLYTRPGTDHSLDRAEEAVAKAVELNPSEVRSWHLLGLVLTAKGEGKKARGVLEVAAAVAESGMGGASGAGETGAGPESMVDGVRSKDYAPTNGNGSTNHTSEVDGLPPSTPVSHSRAASSNGDTSEEEKALLPFDALRIPHASLLLDASPSAPPRSASERLADATQVRMTQLVLVEQIEGGENVGEGWRDVFGWFAAKSTFVNGRMAAGVTGTSVNGGLGRAVSSHRSHRTTQTRMLGGPPRASVDGGSDVRNPMEPSALPPVPISVTPATPAGETFPHHSIGNESADHSTGSLTTNESGAPNGEGGWQEKRNGQSSGLVNGTGNPYGEKEDEDEDRSGGAGDGKRVKKVQRMMKKGVHAGQARIGSISRKIGSDIRRGSGSVRRSRSVADMQGAPPFQASSIHTRRFYPPSVAGTTRPSSPGDTVSGGGASTTVPGPATLPVVSPTSTASPLSSGKNAREQRLLSDLWLMSAATFRRMGKIEQCRGAIQEAEVADENNPAVWVQLGLYFAALGNDRRATDSINKALFIAPDDVSAVVHLCRLHLAQAEAAKCAPMSAPNAVAVTVGGGSSMGEVDLATGMLEACTRGAGWDVPEAWHLLGKAYGLQGRVERERECLLYALELVQGRGIREVGASVGWVV